MNASDSASEPISRPTLRSLQLVPPPPGQAPLQPEPVPFETAPDPAGPLTRPADPAMAAETRRLERELQDVREEVEALQELLEELPSIFERKFRQRLSRVVQEQQQLEAANQVLWTRLRTLAPGTDLEIGPLPPHGLLPPAGSALQPGQDGSGRPSAMPG